MDTVASPPDRNTDELRLLTEWEEAGAGRRRRRAWTISLLLHAAAIAGLAVLPRSFLEPVQRAVLQTVTPLIAPPFEPTQPTPNKGPLSKEITAESTAPRPRIAVPPSPPSTTRPAARVLAMPSPPPAPVPAIPEPPKIVANVQAPPNLSPLLTAPPQIQPEEKPKLMLETPGAEPGTTGRPTGKVPMPGTTVQDAVRAAVRGGAGGGLTIGDAGEPGIGGVGPGMNLPPSPGRRASNLELLSDPMGVDFRPYLIAVLSAVRRNWFAVMPESARLGLRGRVTVQFAVARDGSVPKLVIVGGSGIDAFDRAAVAGVSASNPFPPLPAEFKGEQVRLQLNFSYNIPRN
jgi:TonB family protein